MTARSDHCSVVIARRLYVHFKQRLGTVKLSKQGWRLSNNKYSNGLLINISYDYYGFFHIFLFFARSIRHSINRWNWIAVIARRVTNNLRYRMIFFFLFLALEETVSRDWKLLEWCDNKRSWVLRFCNIYGKGRCHSGHDKLDCNNDTGSYHEEDRSKTKKSKRSRCTFVNSNIVSD